MTHHFLIDFGNTVCNITRMTRKRLAELREKWRKAGKSQNSIAREIGISEAQWSRILARKSKPSRDTELAIEEKTGLTRQDLIEAR